MGGLIGAYIPNVQTCICLILWHSTQVAVIHANGHGHEVAAVRYLVSQFEHIVDTKEIKACIIGGDFTDIRSNFFSELVMWSVGANSNAIAHPMMNILKSAKINLFKIVKNSADENTKITLNLKNGDINILKQNNERAYESLMRDEIKRRNVTALESFKEARIGKNTPYILYRNESCISGQPSGTLPKDGCEDLVINWMPTI